MAGCSWERNATRALLTRRSGRGRRLAWWWGRGLPREPGTAHSTKVARAVLGLGRDLELDVVAEGVETDEQAAVLQQMGCRLAQGYRYARPTLRLAAIAHLLRDPALS